MKRFWFYITLLISVVSSWFLYSIIYKNMFLSEIVLGWVIALLSFAAATFIKFQAAKRPHQEGVVFILKWSIFKLVILATILMAIIAKKQIHIISFVLSFLLSYWAWIIYDVLSLHFKSLGNNKSHE